MLAEKEITLKNTQINSILQNRLFINRLIRFILDSPPKLESLKQMAVDPYLSSLANISEACQIIHSEITRLITDEEASISALKDEFNRLFIGPNTLPAPLWESVYLGKEHLLFEEQTLQVREFYRKHGLSLILEKSEPDDHIVTELEFLNYLIEQTLTSSTTEDAICLLDEQERFLNQHLLKWVPSFCELLTQSSHADLYKGAAFLLYEYIELEQQLITDLKEVLKHEGVKQ